MATSIPDIHSLINKLQQSKDRVLTANPFFGVLALAMSYVSSMDVPLASTDGFKIYLNPNFLEKCAPYELDIVLLHELMHVALKHPFRNAAFLKDPLYHMACDIVVNSNILSAHPEKKVLIVNGQKLPHLCPDGSEGCDHSTLEVYEMLRNKKVDQSKKDKKPSPFQDPNDDFGGGAASGGSDAGLGNHDIPKGKKLFEYVSTKSGIHYFRETAMIDPGNYSSPSLPDPMALSLEKIIACSGHQHHVELSSFEDMDFTPAPLYGKSFPLMKGSDVANVPLKAKTKQSFDFVTLSITQDNHLGIASIKPDKPIHQKIRKQYDDYVKKNYTDFPSVEVRDYFLDLAKKLNFQGPDVPFLCLNYIRSAATYDLDYPRNNTNKDDIIYFLEDAKRGICIHFAMALWYLLLAYDYPARPVVGYRASGGKAKEKIAVYEGDGHAWTECYFPNLGWILLDATPAIANGNSGSSGQGDDQLDSHTKWDPEALTNDALSERVAEIDTKILDGDDMTRLSGRGNIPGSAQCIIKNLREPVIDWREYLASFVQENIVDYSFLNPDTRYACQDFIMPSFSEPDEVVKDVLFMVDTSGSMSDSDLIDCASEIAGAISQFDGKIQGKIGFFDATVQGMTPFDGETDVKSMRIPGRGGTNFHCIFEYVKRHMVDNLPSSIIILTDGEAPFPSESAALGIPVLWLMTTNRVTPPFGQVARLHPKQADL